jgi:hypothetical protein
MTVVTWARLESNVAQWLQDQCKCPHFEAHRTIHCYNERKAIQSIHSDLTVLESGLVDKTSHRYNRHTYILTPGKVRFRADRSAKTKLVDM